MVEKLNSSDSCKDKAYFYGIGSSYTSDCVETALRAKLEILGFIHDVMVEGGEQSITSCCVSKSYIIQSDSHASKTKTKTHASFLPI